ncbi:MAG: metallophosphoesterase family protein, partial [Planctomycetota bacterium]
MALSAAPSDQLLNSHSKPVRTPPLRLAHLSDLHFGRGFNRQLWDHITGILKHESPDALIVSGDIVNSPWPLITMQARKELERLKEQCKATQLFVVPGNHDIGIVGNAAIWPFTKIFDIVFSDAARPLLEDIPDFIDRLGNTRLAVIRRKLRGYSLAWRFVFKTLLQRARPKESYPKFCQVGHVWVAGFNSNNRGSLGILHRWISPLATGWVNRYEFNAVHREVQSLAKADRTALVRIGVLHHHAFPISYPVTHEDVTSYEPFLVLRNSGAVLRALSDHRFDLVLHGHKHVHQFSRVNFESGSQETHTLNILSAGSATAPSTDIRHNSINMITVEPNGRLEVSTYFLEEGATIDASSDSTRNPVTFNEPLTELKSRNFVHAVEHQCVEREALIVGVRIDEFGNLHTTMKIKGLRVREGNETDLRKHIIRLDIQPELTPKVILDDVSLRRGVVLNGRQSEDGKEHLIEVRFPETLRANTAPIDYELSYERLNCFIMTAWEAEQVEEPLEEWRATNIRYPTRLLHIELELPESVGGVSPYLQCRVPHSYPNLDLNEEREIRGFEPVGQLVFDSKVSEFESPNFRKSGSRVWVLDVNYPIVGYTYVIRWELPSISSSVRISGETEGFQKTLIAYRNDLLRETQNETIRKCRADFLAFFAILSEKYGISPDEIFTITLMSYDPDKKLLYLVDGERSKDGMALSWDFTLPLGLGMAGITFKQRRAIVEWVPGSGSPVGQSP